MRKIKNTKGKTQTINRNKIHSGNPETGHGRHINQLTHVGFNEGFPCGDGITRSNVGVTPQQLFLLFEAPIVDLTHTCRCAGLFPFSSLSFSPRTALENSLQVFFPSIVFSSWSKAYRFFFYRSGFLLVFYVMIFKGFL